MPISVLTRYHHRPRAVILSEKVPLPPAYGKNTLLSWANMLDAGVLKFVSCCIEKLKEELCMNKLFTYSTPAAKPKRDYFVCNLSILRTLLWRILGISLADRIVRSYQTFNSNYPQQHMLLLLVWEIVSQVTYLLLSAVIYVVVRGSPSTILVSQHCKHQANLSTENMFSRSPAVTARVNRRTRSLLMCGFLFVVFFK